MRTAHALLVAALLGIATTTLAQHTDPNVARYADQNAALDYLREALFLTPELKETISAGLENITPGQSDGPDPKITIEQKQTIVEQRDMIARLREASLLPNCDWGVDQRDGPNTLLPHLSPHRFFVRLLHLDAIIRIDDGDIDGAVQNAAAIIRMANHMNGADPYLISKLVAVVELKHAQRILERIPTTQLTTDHRRVLKRGITLFPHTDPFQMRHTLVNEVAIISGWLRKQIAAKDGEELRQFLREVALSSPDDTAGDDEHEAELPDKSTVMSYLELYESLSHQIDTAWSSPDGKLDLMILEREITRGSFGPIARILAPSITRIHEQEQEHRELVKTIHDLISR
ncbi:MAG: hypothetical protein ACF8GE_08320 [Phycisphaerales bacterium JB043]